ncbi:uncharacterized protein LOC133453116 [Cololabis saira]|uniref:uncharacterized protein LOC133453116 n=1 Tax=Cololabis saira TaxID=129043 RepID=UPI002AD3FFF3|nr:uncharacterized protein LOC133453116 [Cololabis saira]
MARISAAFSLFLITVLCEGGAAEPCRGPRCLPGPCVGAQCQGRTGAPPPRRLQPHPAQSRAGLRHPNYQQDALLGQHQAQRTPAAAYTVVQPQHGGYAQRAGADGTRRTNPRTVTAEVFHPGCAGGSCPTTVSHRPRGAEGAAGGCAGPGCPPPQQQVSSPVRVTERAAQFLEDSGSERGAWIQLTCDMKPGTNEVPSEDAIVLQLQLSKSQEKLVDALQGQQAEVRELQRLLAEQQGALVSQQREILEQQRTMSQQMEQVKAQYNMLMDSFKQTSFQNLQGEQDSPVVSMDTMSGGVEGLQTQQALSLHKVDMEASVMEVGRRQRACGSCGPEEYCAYGTGRPRCEKCTVCPPGFFLVAQCSVHADRICQDRDECLELSSLCGDQHKCLNTPGGFRCQDMTVRDANSGMCGRGYFFNSDMDECQACNECDGESTVSPCSFVADAVCASPAAGGGGGAMSQSWAGDLSLQGAGEKQGTELQIQGAGRAGLVSAKDGRLLLRQHGLVWLDGTLAVSHGCRSFVQLCLRINETEGGEGRELSGVRVEQRERRSLQGVSISGVVEVAPGHVISLSLRSASPHCNQSGEGLQLYEPPAEPLSLLWVSHDTGAVAMTAQAMVSVQYHTNYRPVFSVTSTSDAYVVSLTHDGRGVRFTESGAVRFVFQQALYSMGQACVSDGFQLAAYLNHNGTAAELLRVFKPGVHYRDTSISLSGAARVGPGDSIAFEILSPAQCNVRFFGDETGISLLSLFWVPAAISSSLSASVASTGLPSGAVKNKPLFFQQTSPPVPQMGLRERGPAGAHVQHPRAFVFRERGTVSLALDLKLIHSCSLVKVTLLRQREAPGSGAGAPEPEGSHPTPLSQQVAGQMPEGSQWTSMSLRASFQVHNGTAVFFLLDCVRGRVNQISHETGSGVSVLWVAA